MAPEIVINPAKAQATKSQPGAPTSRADSAEVIKIPEPIIAPMTSIVASSTPISRCKAAVFADFWCGTASGVVMDGVSPPAESENDGHLTGQRRRDFRVRLANGKSQMANRQ